jgi:hypothetical protein
MAVFYGSCILISILAALIYIPTNRVSQFCFTPHPYQHLLLSVSLIVILTGMRWNLNDISICISFTTKAVEHFFMYLLAICGTFLENHLPILHQD